MIELLAPTELDVSTWKITLFNFCM